MIMLGLTDGGVLGGSLSALHVILWKFALIAFTRAETENEEFKPSKVWWSAVRRFEVRLKAYEERIRRWVMKRESEGEGGSLPPDSVSYHNKWLEPCAHLSEEGEVSWHPRMMALLAGASAEAERRRMSSIHRAIRQEKRRSKKRGR